MTITRDQFLRGFTAIQASFARQGAMNAASRAAGIEDYDHGVDPVVYELQRLLEEVCGDEDGPGGTAISYALHECHVVRPKEGAEEFRMDSGEAVWRWWEETKTGPFKPEPLRQKVAALSQMDDRVEALKGRLDLAATAIKSALDAYRPWTGKTAKQERADADLLAALGEVMAAVDGAPL